MRARRVEPGDSQITKGTNDPHTVLLSDRLCDHHARQVYKALKRVLSRQPFRVLK